MKCLLRHYRNLKLSHKLMITHMVVALLPMLLIAVFFAPSLYDMILSDTIRREQQATATVAPTIEATIQQIQMAADELDQSQWMTAVKQMMNEDGSAPTSAALQQFSEQLSALRERGVIEQFRLYIDWPEAAESNDFLLPTAEARGTYWHGIFQGSPRTATLFCPTFYLSSSEASNYGKLAYIRRLRSNGGSYYMALYFSEDRLTSLLQESLTTKDNLAYLINSRDNLVTASDSNQVGAYYLSYEAIREQLLSSNNFVKKIVLGKEIYAGFYSIRNTDWYMVISIPTEPIIRKSINLLTLVGILYLLIIFLSLYIAGLLSRSITNRLGRVVHRMAQCRVAPPVALTDSEHTDEIDTLINTYNYMVRMINELMDKQTAQAEELRISEFRSLQAQINPHFLYNTMDMISWLSKQGRTEEATAAIWQLSRFYKLTLSRKSPFSTLANEIEHTEIYVQLQNMRFADGIDLLIDIPDDLLDISIPKLTLQPIVENSILHGIMEKPCKTGQIVITAWQEERYLYIMISDDGVGMSDETLATILSENTTPTTQTEPRKGTNIAIYNTHRRLQVLYGDDCGLQYNSVPSEGTEVIVCIPNGE